MPSNSILEIRGSGIFVFRFRYRERAIATSFDRNFTIASPDFILVIPWLDRGSTQPGNQAPTF
jgi:hypothetical protein